MTNRTGLLDTAFRRNYNEPRRGLSRSPAGLVVEPSSRDQIVLGGNSPPSEVWGGVPAHFIMTTKEYAEKCKHNTPAYDLENYKRNFKEEVNRICDMVESKK